MEDIFSRTELLIGSENMMTLKNSKVCIVGVGGVGGSVLEMLARAGVQNFVLVDGDVVSVSNKNRQIIALDSTIGRKKVDVFENRLLDINSNIKIEKYDYNLTEKNVENIITNDIDYVVDAIDSTADKIALIVFCKRNNIPIISSMGAGNRFQNIKFAVSDISKTEYDGLAKIVRKKLREIGIKNHKVVFSPTQSISTGRVIGSISFVPIICGAYLASEVVNDLLRNKK